MRWIQYLLIIVLVGGIQYIFPQSYIIKFKSESADTVAVRSTLNDYSKKTGQQQNSLRRYTLTGLSSGSASFTSKFPWEKYVILRANDGIDPQLTEAIQMHPDVEYLQTVQTYRVYAQPNDSAYSSQWNLGRIGITRLYTSGVISSSLPPVIVGVIDTGIDDGHPDLAPVIAVHPGESGVDGLGNDKRSNGVDDDGNGFIDDWRGYDFVESETQASGDWNERDNDPYDENGHGTAVSGIIGARVNNGIGLAGVAPCSILPLRAFGKDGNGNDIDIASAIVYAVDNGAEVINMSFGDVVRSLFLQDAVRYARAAGRILVASSGNDGSSNPHFPSDFPEVISTGSVNRYDIRSFFSSNSPALSLMAPGEEIITTTAGGGYTSNFSGTSAAAPHVSGVVALIRSVEKMKIAGQPNSIPLSPEEITGLLLNTADDAGIKGWDALYAAGILNAEKALHAVSGSSVVIHSPVQDEILTGGYSNVIVTAATPYLRSVQLMYGRGETPTQWTTIASIENTVLVRDTIPFMVSDSLPDDFYILRLIVKNSKGNDIEYRQRFRILHSSPRILSFRFRDSVIIGDRYGSVIEARTDRNTAAQLHYRPVGEQKYQHLRSAGDQMNHSFVLTADTFLPNVLYEIYCEFTENSSSRRSSSFYLTDSIGSALMMPAYILPTTGFDRKSYSLPKGFILHSVRMVNNHPSIILNEYDQNDDFGKLKIFGFSGSQFTVYDSIVRPWIPRSYYSPIHSAAQWLLVQDHGVSSIFEIDTLTGTISSSPVWGDSSDVWASQLIDLDGDGLPEIIARSSAEYLVYKNSGNNSFTLTARLPNVSPPLSGDAKNQFGPPRSVVGDFTNSGKSEIVFADYDGDLLMYRQSATNSLSFVLAGIDTTELFEQSDYMTAGDFNGDGRIDFAVAGHSNIDWNQDREYDLPVWTVRVFSHRASDQPGTVTKIWEQHFTGVRSGSRYDNGLAAGRLSPSEPKDALMLSLNPNLYVFLWNETAQTFEPLWNHSSQSNSVIVYDFDNDNVNELGFSVDGKIEFWSKSVNLFPVPWGLMAVALSRTEAQVRWSSSAANHNLYRGRHPDSLIFITSVSGTEWRDTVLNENTQYYYAVTSLNPGESPRSEIVSIIPHAPVRILSADQVSPTQLKISLSFDVLSEDVAGFTFAVDTPFRSTSVLWISSRSLLASFTDTIPKGLHTVRIVQLIDASGLLGDTANAFSFTSSYQFINEFFVRSVALKSWNEIAVDFSAVPDSISALQPVHYSVKTIAREFHVIAVTRDTLNPRRVFLRFSESTNLSAIALRLEVSISENITSAEGVAIMGGKGQILSIAQSIDHISEIVVFPNPVHSGNLLQFVNIPAHCTITVYSLTGEKIKTIQDVSAGEGISWNLLDERGNPLSSGVYLYRVEMRDEGGSVLKTHLGKFAVLR
ncbi:MAG: S8 family serine peptidase [Bacteroidota bacterium]